MDITDRKSWPSHRTEPQILPAAEEFSDSAVERISAYPDPPTQDLAGPLEETRTLFRPVVRDTAQPVVIEDPVVANSVLSAVPSAYPSSSTSSPSSGSSASLTHPSQWVNDPGKAVSPGTVLKDRFALEEIIGRGGMGVVFKAKDLRKEEAQDRFPYVAIKILNEDFRRHPASLKALQREARKAQALAHPNIAAVYDFDRDGPLVFLVMEILEGASLHRLIKERAGRGLPRNEALRIVQGCGLALAYAHKKGVLHADFKPANAFRTTDGSVKVLDFGLARGLARPDRVINEQTLFDAGSLGALTPSYASCEMLVGEQPDPRDDVFALACVTYELLSGRHPFNHLSALLAERRTLRPERVDGLDRRTWRALLRGLAFKRADRTPSIEEFVSQLSPKTYRRAAVVVGGLGAAALLAALAVYLPGYFDDRRVGQLSSQLASQLNGTDPTRTERVLSQLAALTPARRDALFSDDVNKAAVINYIESKVNSLTDESAGRFDYAEAERALQEIAGWVRDSARLKDIQDTLAARKTAAFTRETGMLADYRQKGWLTAAQNPENAMDALTILRRIDPKQAPAAPSLLPAFSAAIRDALTRGDVGTAGSLLQSALAIAPADADTQALAADVRRREETSRQASLAPDQPTRHVAVAERVPVNIESQTPTRAPTPAASAEVSSGSGSVNRLKQQLISTAATDEIADALTLLRELKQRLPEDDSFLRDDAPLAIGNAYLRLAERAFADGSYETAATLLERAQESAPNFSVFGARKEQVDRVRKLQTMLMSGSNLTVETIDEQMKEIRADEGPAYQSIRLHLADSFAQRIQAEQRRSPKSANQLLQLANKVFIAIPAIERLEPVAESDDPPRVF